MNSNYVPRVTQLDALQLDEEVVEIFKTQLSECTKYLSPGLLTPLTPELEFLLRYVIFKFSILKTSKTFGQQMLSLQYDEKLLSRGKMYWLFGYTILLKYIRERLFMSYTANISVQKFLTYLEKIQIVGDFINMIRFLQTGRKPTLVEYLLNIEMQSTKRITNQYTDLSWTRELLWHSFVELFGVMTPVLKTKHFRRVVRDKSLALFGRKNIMYSSFVNSNPDLTKDTKCAECKENPILPHFMGCEHIFCHFCLQSNKLDDPYYKCPSCNFCGDAVMKLPSC